MRYTWDFNELRENKNKLINLLNSNISTDEREIVLETIDEYDNLLSLARKNGNYNVFSNDYDINNTSISELIDNIIKFYNTENSNSLDVLESLILSIPTLKDANTQKDYVFINLGDNNDEVMEWILSFFVTMTNKEMQNTAVKIFNPNNHILNISNHSKSNVRGILGTDYFNNKKYIGLCRNNDTLDLSNMIHEMFHYIFTDVRSFNLNSGRNYWITTEVESKFGNLLFAEYFSSLNKTNENINLNVFREYELALYKDMIEILYIRDSIIGSLNDKKKIRFNKLNKMLEGYHSYQFTNSEQLIPYFQEDEKELMVYTLGYLVALDLLNIYKRDREFAFYLLKNIKHNISEDNILSLLNRNHITFMEDDYANLKKYIKSMTN